MMTLLSDRQIVLIGVEDRIAMEFVQSEINGAKTAKNIDCANVFIILPLLSFHRRTATRRPNDVVSNHRRLFCHRASSRNPVLNSTSIHIIDSGNWVTTHDGHGWRRWRGHRQL